MKRKPAAASSATKTTSVRTIFFIWPFLPYRVAAMADSSGSDHPMAAGPPASDLALVLSGGGARGAYQAGVLRRIAHRFPDLHFPIITGVSAGAINASFIAAHPGTLAE